MTVIAKMNVASEPRDYGQNQLVELSCVCDNELMVIHTPENENHTFCQASPSGDARITLSKNVELRSSEELYLIFEKSTDTPIFEDAIAVVDARCASITDYGGVSRRVEIAATYRYHKDAKKHPRQVEQFNLRMMIDNPLASIQFEAGQEGYWIGIYRASEMTMREALTKARA